MFNQTYQEGPIAVNVNVSAGQASITATAGGSLGGGNLTGVVKYQSSNSIILSDAILIQAGFAAAKAKYPGLVPLLQPAEDEILALTGGPTAT